MRLGAINKYTGENVSRSLTEHSGVKGLIIDLRGNPGGMLQEAVRVAGLFIDGGIVASSKGRSPDSTEYYNAPAGDVLDNKPIVVLIDGQTASSAEVWRQRFRNKAGLLWSEPAAMAKEPCKS